MNPYYIKYEKLDNMVRIQDSKNFGQILNELLIYLNEADPHFVGKTMKSIGKRALTYDQALDKKNDPLNQQYNFNFHGFCQKKSKTNRPKQRVTYLKLTYVQKTNIFHFSFISTKIIQDIFKVRINSRKKNNN